MLARDSEGSMACSGEVARRGSVEAVSQAEVAKAMAALDATVAEHPTETILLWNTLSTTGRAPAA